MLRFCCSAAHWGATVDAIMIAVDYLKRIAAWSRELNEKEIDVARAGIVEKSYRANEFIFLVRQLNERVGQFIGALEHDRMLDATSRVARSIASLFNPILYPDMTRHLEITQEEIGALSGISRQNANQCLKRLEQEGLLRLEYGGVTIIELEHLRHHGE